MNKKPKEIHIGERIREIFDKKNISITQFANLLHCDRANVYNIFRRKKIDIYRLLEISEILNYDFIEEICVQYGHSKDTTPSKTSFVLEINSMDDKALNGFLEGMKQLGIERVWEVRD